MIDEIITALKTRCPLFEERIEDALVAGALERELFPLAIVYPAADTLEGVSMQCTMIRRQWSVLIVANASLQLEQAIKEVNDALIDLRLTGCISALAFAGGKLEQVEQMTLKWSSHFEAKLSI